jgi:NodT family efflux transporter outer membrane factor (OMF) lipoprotein
MRKARFLFGLLCFLISAWGCNVHKPVKIEPPVLPAAFSEGRPGGETPEIGRWWLLFDDARLTALVEEGLRGNLDIAQAYARLRQLQTAAKKIEAGRLPFADLDGQGGRSSQPAAGGGMEGDSSRLALAAGYELDLWRKLASAGEAASLDVLASREDLKTLYMSLTAQIVDLYYLAVEQRVQLARLDAIIQSYVVTLDLVEARYEEGQVSAIDVYQARQNLAAARSRRPDFQVNLSAAEHAIAVLLGRFPDRETAGHLAVLPAAPAAYPAGLPAALLQSRPDIKAAALRVSASDKRLGAAIADRFPSFNLLADYGHSRTALASVLSGSFWDLIVQASLPVFDGGRRRVEIERQQAIVQEAAAQYRQVIIRAFQEVDDALAKNAASEERLSLLERQQEIAGDGAAYARESYRQGLGDFLPVLLAEQALLETETRMINARRQLISDRVSLIRVLGGMWPDEFVKMETNKGETAGR